MSNAIFPTLAGLAFPVTRKPIWNTTVQESVSGKETRVGYWTYPRWEYNLSVELLRTHGGYSELQTLLGFFNARRGRLDDWLFLDPDDNSVNGAAFGIGDGVTTVFQLTRPYGGWVEPVRAVNYVGSIQANGVQQPDHILDQFSGQITFNSPPASGVILSWTGSFYWRCRFIEDELETSKILSGIFTAEDFAFRTLK